MNHDVTVTISTGGDGTISTATPGPNPSDVAHAERLDGAPRGPIPTPLDQLPKPVSTALGDASTGRGAPPAPLEIANLAAFAATAGGQAPPPMDLDLLGPAARSSATRKPATRKPATRKPATRKPK